MIPIEASRNPDLSRRAMAIEFGVVLTVAWLPLFVAGSMSRGEPQNRTVATELYGMLIEGGIIGLLLFFLWRNGESWRHVGLRRFRWWSEILWAILIYAACWTSWIILGTWGRILLGDGPETRAPEDHPGTLYTVLLPLFLVVSAFFEELLVRGYLWNRLLRFTGNKGVALFGSALLFTAYHPYPLGDLVYIFTFGVVIGLFNWKARSLPRLILAHTLFNLAISYINVP